MHDGKDVKLEQKFTVQVAPMGVDVQVPAGSATCQRRPTLHSMQRVQCNSSLQSPGPVGYANHVLKAYALTCCGL